MPACTACCGTCAESLMTQGRQRLLRPEPQTPIPDPRLGGFEGQVKPKTVRKKG